VSLVNTVLSYDCTGYVRNSLLKGIGYPLFKCYRLKWRLRINDNTSLALTADIDRV